MSESPIPDEPGPAVGAEQDDPADPFDPAADVFDLDSGFDVVHAQKPPEDYDAAAAAPRFIFAVTPPRGGALAEQIDRFMALFLGYHDDRAAPVRMGPACYALYCPGGAAEAEALRSALSRTLFEADDKALVSVGPEDEVVDDEPDQAGRPDAEPEPAFEEACEPVEVQPVDDDGEEDWLNAAATNAAHADGDTFDLDLLGPPPETEAEPEPEPDVAPHLAAENPADVDAGSQSGPPGQGPAEVHEPDDADTFRADMRAIAEAARGEGDAAAPVEDFQAALEGLIGDLDARLGAAADRLEESAAHVDERAREALNALLSAGESLRGYARRTAGAGGGDDGRLDRMEAGLHAALDRLAEAQTAQEARIAERVIAALGGGRDADRAA